MHGRFPLKRSASTAARTPLPSAGWVLPGLLLAAAFGCARPNFEQQRLAIEPESPTSILVRNDDGLEVVERDGRATLQMRVEGQDQLTCDGVLIEDERGARTAPLRVESADPRRVVLVVEDDPAHAIELVGTRDGSSWNFLLTDRIATRATVRRVAVAWRQERGRPKLDVPWTDGAILDDERLRSGTIRVTTSSGAAVLTTDLERLIIERRLPWFLDSETGAEGAQIVVGCREPEGRTLRDDRLQFGFRIGVAPLESSDALFDQELRVQWERSSHDLVRESGFPLTEDERISDLLTDSRRTLVRQLQTLGWPHEEGTAVSLETLCRLAYLLAGPDARVTSQDALGLVDRVLAQRFDSGLLPASIDARGVAQVAPRGESGADRPRAAESARCANVLLDLLGSVPARRMEIRDLTQTLARTLVAGQRDDGLFPARFTPDRDDGLGGIAEGGPDGVGATTATALLLARMSTQASEFRDPAVRAVQALAERLDEGASFIDRPTSRPSSDPRSYGARIEMQPLAEALEAWALLYGLGLGDLRHGETFARHAQRAQRHVALPFGELPTPGGFPEILGDRQDSARTTASMARALLHAAAVTGRSDWASRGAAATRAVAHDSIQIEDPVCPSDLQAIEKQFGSAFVLRTGDDIDPTGFAQGIDALWFEEVEFEPSRVRAGLWSSTDHDPVHVVVQVSPRSASQNPAPRLELESREPQVVSATLSRVVLRTEPIRIPRVVLDRPGSLGLGTAWLPRCTIDDPTLSTGLEIEVQAPNRRLARLRLVSSSGSDDPTLLEAERPVLLPTLGEEISVSLFLVDEGEDRLLSKTDGIRLGTWEAIELGTTDSGWIGLPRPDRVRFADGRRNAFAATEQRPLLCTIPLDPDVETVLVEATVAGSLVVRSGTSEVHRSEGLRTDPRTLRFRLSDRRLWSSGQMELSFAGADTCEIAHIRWQSRGVTRLRGSDAFAGGPDELARPIGARVRITVVPFSRDASTVTPGSEDLRRAFFGGADYQRTPQPKPRRTIGSAARWVEELSGGRTKLEGRVLENAVRASGTDLEALLPEIARQLQPENVLADDPNLIVLVGGSRPDGPTSVTVDRELVRDPNGSLPILWLPDRESDGSFLSCGRITAEVLAVLTGRDADRPLVGDGIVGPFGNNGHLPGAPRIEWLEQIGWADLRQVAVTDARYRSRLSLAPLLTGRNAIALRLRDGRETASTHQLILSLRGGHPADPGGGSPGLWVRHRIGEAIAPVLHRLDGSRTDLVEWSLSAVRPEWMSTSAAPRSEDLFRQISQLDDDSSPTILGVDGTLPYALNRWSINGEDAILNTELVSYRGAFEEHTLAESSDPDDPTQTRIAITPPRSPTGLTRTTLMLTVGLESETLPLLLRRPGRPDLTFPLEPGRTTLEIDQPHVDDEAFTVVLPANRRGEVAIDALVSVPLATRRAEFAVPERLLTCADGTTRVVREIRADESGRFVIRVPMLLEAQPTLACLRLQTPTGAQVRLTGRTTDATDDRVLIDAHEATQPISRLWAELPQVDQSGPIFLELTGQTRPGGRVQLLDLWLRPAGGE